MILLKLGRLYQITMARKHIKSDGRGGAQELGKIKEYKAKPKPWKESQWMRNYRLNRERALWKLYPERRSEIEQYVKEMKEQWQKQDKTSPTQ
jgi:replication-associated recombination protein RarA